MMNKKYCDLINKEKMPVHVAVIMDGNGRWAKKRNMPRLFGHRQGVETVRTIVKACVDLDIKYLTLYAFSTENWKRPQDEVDGLMRLMIEYFKKEIDQLDKEGVRVRIIGAVDAMPENTKKCAVDAIEKTKNNTVLNLNIALNYGGRADIIHATKQVTRQVKDGELSIEDINEEMFGDFLYTKDMPDPDLMIRTGGEMRISNFLIWQLSYAELWFTNTYWPDFTKQTLCNAIYDFQNRDRRYGGLNN
jgi:undecaprenyl diphosphate synthase